jgi:hypothetical protein
VAAAGLVDSAAAETYARLLAEAELRRAVISPGFRWLDPDYELTSRPPDEEGLLRVKAVVSALGKVGALAEETGRSVLADMAAALALRGLRAPGALLSAATASGPSAAPPPGRSRPVTPGGYRAIPVGAVLPADLGGYQGDVHLQALVLAPDRAAIVTCFVSTWRETSARPAGRAVAQPSFPPFGGSGLTDDQGRSYRLSFEAAEGGWQERGVLDISPVPPAGTRWLDLPTGSGPVIRISLTGAGRAARVGTQRITPLSVGERLLTAVAETMLGGGPMAGIEATLLAASLAEVAEALEAVRALPPGSRAAAQLAALCQRRAIEVHGQLAERCLAVRLPEPWASVLSNSQHWDGWPGVAPAAVVLPEIDGARFVLAGLSSWERQASLQMFAWGWQWESRGFPYSQPFSWWARDNAGRWHVGRPNPHHVVAGTFQLELTPPLDPAATALDIMVTGRSSRVTATMPLNWQGRPG